LIRKNLTTPDFYIDPKKSQRVVFQLFGIFDFRAATHGNITATAPQRHSATAPQRHHDTKSPFSFKFTVV
jgi:hypothetical protein